MAILSNSGRVAYGVKRFMVRTVEDILTIPLTPSIKPGSTVFVTSNQSKYILDLDYNWVQLKDTPNDSPDEPEQEEVIYEGGDISNPVMEIESDYEGGEI